MTWSAAAVRLAVPPLVSGGLLLTYRCSSACRHCLVRGSPARPDTWIDPDMADRAFAALARESCLEGIHLAGGEATLRMDLLLDVVRLAVRRGIPLDYLETNAGWCHSREVALDGMRRLREAGLRAVLVSASPYHNEFIPFHATRLAVEAALEVFGARGTFVYTSLAYEMLSALPGDGRHPLPRQLEAWGLDGDPRGVLRVYPVVPGGRAVAGLRSCWPARPASAYRSIDCYQDLTSTSHFHLDPDGNLFTGLCVGLAVATIDDLHPDITAGAHPLFDCLATAGPHGLMRLAAERHGFVERPAGYVSRCDLCLDVRGHLAGTGLYPELRPIDFYGPDVAIPPLRPE
jgi:hypothetical protein